MPAPGLHPANPTSCQITEGQCKTQLHFRGGFFCHKVAPNYPASRSLSMQANNISWGRVTQQDTGGGVGKRKLRNGATSEEFLSTVAIQTPQTAKAQRRIPERQQAPSQKVW